MNRNMFLVDLRKCLTFMPEAEREETLRHYEELFDQAGPENEQKVIAELGSPTKVAVNIHRGNSHRSDELAGLEMLFGTRAVAAETEIVPVTGPDPEEEIPPEAEAEAAEAPPTEVEAEPENALEPEAEAEAAEEAASEPEGEAEPEAAPEIAEEAAPEPEGEAEPEAAPETAEEAASEPEGEAEPEAAPEAAGEAASEPESGAEPEAAPETGEETPPEQEGEEETGEPSSEEEPQLRVVHVPTGDPRRAVSKAAEAGTDPEPEEALRKLPAWAVALILVVSCWIWVPLLAAAVVIVMGIFAALLTAGAAVVAGAGYLCISAIWALGFLPDALLMFGGAAVALAVGLVLLWFAIWTGIRLAILLVKGVAGLYRSLFLGKPGKEDVR